MSGGIFVDQKISINAPAEVEAHMIDTRQWRSLRRKIEALAYLEKGFASAAWAFAGLAISGFIALLTWLPAFRALTFQLQAEFAWVWVVLAALTVLGVGVSIALGIAHKTIHGNKATSVASVLEDMDGIVQQ